MGDEQSLAAEIEQRLAAALSTVAGGQVAPAIAAGLAAYEQARLDGLCDDGAWECALEAARGAARRPAR
ncbi:MAG: hypothetical protein BWY52_02186 [Chloroflexi bacterium ADurb.Bin325]|nr:MAG: hypothetical protein BWY52_02186 [Chloroflexi bacterium ADurb.Bin325]